MNTRPMSDADERISRNLAAAKQFLRSIIADPEMIDTIPDGATIYVIPEDDPELAGINERAAERARRNDATVHVHHLPARRTRSDDEPDAGTEQSSSPARPDLLQTRKSGRMPVASYQKVKAARALRRIQQGRGVKAPWRDNHHTEAKVNTH